MYIWWSFFYLFFISLFSNALVSFWSNFRLSGLLYRLSWYSKKYIGAVNLVMSVVAITLYIIAFGGLDFNFLSWWERKKMMYYDCLLNFPLNYLLNNIHSITNRIYCSFLSCKAFHASALVECYYELIIAWFISFFPQCSTNFMDFINFCLLVAKTSILVVCGDLHLIWRVCERKKRLLPRLGFAGEFSNGV